MIRVKVARNGRELDDVFHLRWHVYAQEEGLFGGSGSVPYISDRFDAHPVCYNLIAYDGAEPVATLRLNGDTGAGLPADRYFDFSAYRRSLVEEASRPGGRPPSLGCASMLAVRRRWRHRRDIIATLFKMAAGLGLAHGTTHVIVAVAERTQAMYRRMGFAPVGERTWIEEIGDHVVPLAAPFDAFARWAFDRRLLQPHSMALLEGETERILLSAGETLFREGERGEECYMVESGLLRATRRASQDGRELLLATFAPGDIVGELALIDDEPRSATVTAASNSEVLVLGREEFRRRLGGPHGDPDTLLRIFAERMRRMDDLALLLAYGGAHQKLLYALRSLYRAATPERRRPEVRSVTASAEDIAQMAGVDPAVAQAALEWLQQTGACEVRGRRVRFLREPAAAMEEAQTPFTPRPAGASRPEGDGKVPLALAASRPRR
ncbi:MAG TPA: cyclic nucleotide-binding domain-containing protein [Chromatiales bacterium]|nr:cyclic nucleotide-binding domain-containing protein [Chromatiales bacterium]